MPSESPISIHPMLLLIFSQHGSSDKEHIDPDAAWHYYSHSICRNPYDLKLHTHRIFFAMKHKNAELLAGSLHDLFFILKDAGENLRIRLLKASAPFLNERDIFYFAMWIKVGIKKGLGYKWIPGAVLSNGLHGPDKPLLEVIQSEENHLTLSPLEEARSCMEYGQLDVAKKILQDALEKDSGNKAIQDELQYLTKYTKSVQIQPEQDTPKNTINSTFVKIKEAVFHQ